MAVDGRAVLDLRRVNRRAVKVNKRKRELLCFPFCVDDNIACDVVERFVPSDELFSWGIDHVWRSCGRAVFHHFGFECRFAVFESDRILVKFVHGGNFNVFRHL